jgi:hypothetical protein
MTIAARALDMWASAAQAPIIIKNPHALPMYREEGQPTGGGRKRKVCLCDCLLLT